MIWFITLPSSWFTFLSKSVTRIWSYNSWDGTLHLMILCILIHLEQSIDRNYRRTRVSCYSCYSCTSYLQWYSIITDNIIHPNIGGFRENNQPFNLSKVNNFCSWNAWTKAESWIEKFFLWSSLITLKSFNTIHDNIWSLYFVKTLHNWWRYIPPPGLSINV